MGIIAVLCAFHAALTSQYQDTLPIMLCFPLIEILLMEVTFGALAVAAATVLHPKDSVHWGYVVAASAVFVLILLYMFWSTHVVRSSCSHDGADVSFIPFVGQQEDPKEAHPEGELKKSTYVETFAELELNSFQQMVYRDEVDGALAEGAATELKDKGDQDCTTPNRAETISIKQHAMDSPIPESPPKVPVVQGQWRGGKAEQKAKLLFSELEVMVSVIA